MAPGLCGTELRQVALLIIWRPAGAGMKGAIGTSICPEHLCPPQPWRPQRSRGHQAVGPVVAHRCQSLLLAVRSSSLGSSHIEG